MWLQKYTHVARALLNRANSERMFSSVVSPGPGIAPSFSCFSSPSLYFPSSKSAVGGNNDHRDRNGWIKASALLGALGIADRTHTEIPKSRPTAEFLRHFLLPCCMALEFQIGSMLYKYLTFVPWCSICSCSDCSSCSKTMILPRMRQEDTRIHGRLCRLRFGEWSSGVCSRSIYYYYVLLRTIESGTS